MHFVFMSPYSAIWQRLSFLVFHDLDTIEECPGLPLLSWEIIGKFSLLIYLSHSFVLLLNAMYFEIFFPIITKKIIWHHLIKIFCQIIRCPLSLSRKLSFWHLKSKYRIWNPFLPHHLINQLNISIFLPKSQISTRKELKP